MNEKVNVSPEEEIITKEWQINRLMTNDYENFRAIWLKYCLVKLCQVHVQIYHSGIHLYFDH